MTDPTLDAELNQSNPIVIYYNSWQRTANSPQSRRIFTIISNLICTKRKCAKIHLGINELHFKIVIR